MTDTLFDPLDTSHPDAARLPHAPEFENGVMFANGPYVPPADATISIMDAGFTNSDVVYDVLTVMRGRYFRIEDHFSRFAKSLASFRLTNPHTEDEMRGIFDTLLSLNGVRNGQIGWFVTRGVFKPGSVPARDRNNPDAYEPRFYASSGGGYGSMIDQAERERGLDVMISTTRIRTPPEAVDPTAKNYHWMDMKLALFDARDAGYNWAVLPDRDGNITEAPGANVFVVKDGELYTPDRGCLLGITRLSAIEIAESLGLTVHIEPVHSDQLREADEAFMTSSAGGIMPLNSVDGIVHGGTEGPGELSRRIHELYWERMCDGWHGTPVTYRAV